MGACSGSSVKSGTSLSPHCKSSARRDEAACVGRLLHQPLERISSQESGWPRQGVQEEQAKQPMVPPKRMGLCLKENVLRRRLCRSNSMWAVGVMLMTAECPQVPGSAQVSSPGPACPAVMGRRGMGQARHTLGKRQSSCLFFPTNPSPRDHQGQNPHQNVGCCHKVRRHLLLLLLLSLSWSMEFHPLTLK